MSGWGGKREGAGRRAGSKNAATIEREAEAAERVAAIKVAGITPLEYFLAIMRDEKLPQHERFAAAKEAAPYVHARLASVDVSGGLALHHMTHEEALAEMEKLAKAAEGHGEPTSFHPAGVSP